MGFALASIIAFSFLIIGPCTPSPIMVKFGTKEGPIIPPPSTTTVAPDTYTFKPAPVYEKSDDLPNPNVYKPLVPYQYRKKIYSYKPNPNLILGTPLDRKYKLGGYKYFGDRKFQKAFGLDYKGPQIFIYQDYEQKYQKIDNVEKYSKAQYEKRSYDNGVKDQDLSATRSVPQIGVVYSSGIRYYVPQIFYHTDDIDNSVYEANDLKFYHQKHNYY